MATINPFTNKNPYQQNQSKPAQTAAASSVTKTPTSFLQNASNWIGNTFNSAKNAVGGFLNTPHGGSSIAQNVSSIGNILNSIKANNKQVATPYGYTDPAQASEQYLKAGAPIPPDIAKVYGPQAPNYDVARTGNQTAQNPEAITGKTQGAGSGVGAVVNNNLPKAGVATDFGGNNTNTNNNVQVDGSTQSATPTAPIQDNTSAQSSVIQNMANTQNPTLYQQIVNSLMNLRSNPDVQKSIQNVQDVQNEENQALANTERMPMTAGNLQGSENLLQNTYAKKIANAQAALQNTLTQQGNQVGALESAGGMAAPLQVPYSNQIINPLTGQPIQGTGTTGGLGGSVPDIANAVLNGKMSWTDAQSQLGGIPTLTNQLRSAIQQKNPNFNFNLSAASAQTQQQGQQIGTFANSANAALDKLQTDFNNLSGALKTGIPGTIGIEQWIGGALGNSGLSTYQTTLHDARAQLSGVLATAGGMTPTSADETAKTYLPDNMTSQQLSSKIAAAKALIQQKVQAFQQSGQQSSQQNTGNNIWSF